jgi:hypothetical protein
VNAASFTVGSNFIANSSALTTLSNTATIGTAAYVVANGNIGLSNSSPAAKLDINGNMRLDSSGYPFANFNNTNNANYFLLSFTENATQKTYVGLGGSNQAGFSTYAAYQQDGFSINHDGAGRTTISNRGTSKTIWLATGGETSADFPTIIIKNKITTFPTQPRFYAYGVSGGTFVTNSYWIFPTTRVNVGSHYNTSTGTFTVPTDGGGSYLFFWGNLGYNSIDRTVYRYFIRVNNTNVGDVHLRQDLSSNGTNYESSASINLLLNLSAGDNVRIFFSSDSGANSFPNANAPADYYPYFGGYLVG